MPYSETLINNRVRILQNISAEHEGNRRSRFILYILAASAWNWFCCCAIRHCSVLELGFACRKQPVKALGGDAWTGTLDEHSYYSTCGLTQEQGRIPRNPICCKHPFPRRKEIAWHGFTEPKELVCWTDIWLHSQLHLIPFTAHSPFHREHL